MGDGSQYWIILVKVLRYLMGKNFTFAKKFWALKILKGKSTTVLVSILPSKTGILFFTFMG